MKNIHIAIISIILFSSCQPMLYYQMYEVKPTKKTAPINDELVYEDSNCKISYNFWSNGGNAGFRFYNKTNDDIYLLLDKSNFILNGVAYDYYKNREYTTSKGSAIASSKFSQSGASVSASGSVQNGTTTTRDDVYSAYPYQSSSSSSSSSSASVNASRGSATIRSVSSGKSLKVTEDSVIRIPGNSQKSITEYSINRSIVRNCDLVLRPTIEGQKIEIFYSSYDEASSPLLFSNLIRYRVNGSVNSVRNEFYVNRVSNYHPKSFFEYKYDEFCGVKDYNKSKYFKYIKRSNFYHTYR
jgi:hypothetical protein